MVNERLYIAWLASVIVGLLLGAVLLWPGCTIGCPTGSCDGRAVPAPGGPL